MRFTLAAIGALLPIVALAANFDVNVGQEGLTFSPNQVAAAVGDTVTFRFYPKAHSVTQSTFAAPCTPIEEGGFHTGFVTVAEGVSESVYVFNVTSADAPSWFYCAQGQHCQQGMVFAINAPAEGNTFEAFQAAAGTAESGTPPTTSVPPVAAPPSTTGAPGASGAPSGPGGSAPTRPVSSPPATGANTPSGSPSPSRSAGADKLALPVSGLLAGLLGAIVAL